MAQTDSALMQRLQERDQRAFETLYDRLAPLVNAVLLRMLDDQSAAAEVLEETFWQVWSNAASYDASRGTVKGWVLAIARSRALDRLRTQKRQTGGLAAYEAEGTSAPSQTPMPEALALQDERGRAVAAALHALPHEQRLAIELAYYKGLSQAEIAERLAQPLGTIKTRIRLGLARLYKVLEPYLGEHA